jgi:uncharacterized protein
VKSAIPVSHSASSYLLQHVHDLRVVRAPAKLERQKWYIAALLSWGIALFEYLFQVPANRLGYETLSLAQLKVLQEIIALSFFAPFAVLYMHQPIKLDYLWSGLCLAAAAYFMFRS